MRVVLGIFLVAMWIGAANAACHGAESADGKDDGALAIFEKRILPIFQSQKPSSCAECHLSGVDLKDYIRADQQQTFASLVAAGMVDLKSPDKSKILQFIRRAPEKPSLVGQKVRRQEYEAFRAWILAAVKDPALLVAKDAAAPIGPTVPVEVVRHARTDRVLASFVDNVWSEVGRCAACHSPDRNQKQVAEHGEQVSWIKLNDPRATLTHMIEEGLIDPDDPAGSLLLAKPTMQVEHGGGIKMLVGDRSYKQFRRFIDDYAAVAKASYKSADDLPPQRDDVSAVSDIWLKIEGAPERFDQMLLAADLYRWIDGPQPGWSKERWAWGDRGVFGKGKLWQQHLTLVAPRDTERADELRRRQQLPPGRYLVKIYVDQQGKLQRDFRQSLDERDFVGQVEVETRWPPGYGKMTVVQYPSK